MNACPPPFVSAEQAAEELVLEEALEDKRFGTIL